MAETEIEPDAVPRRLLIAVLVLAVVSVGGLLAFAALHREPEPPLVLAAVPAPKAGDPGCRALLDGLPEQLGDYHRATLVDPAPEGAAAWTGATDPVVLRCGLDRPADFVVGSPLQGVDAVQWFRVPENDRSTWYAVDRPVYVALTLPSGSGPTPIQVLSGLIDRVLPAVPIQPGPAA